MHKSKVEPPPSLTVISKTETTVTISSHSYEAALAYFQKDTVFLSDMPIRLQRVRKGMSVTSLAKQIGVKDCYISAIETNKRKGSLEILYKISQVLDISFADIATSKGIKG